MGSLVKAADAVAAAIEIEKRGQAFYAEAENKAQLPAAKDFFAFMAKEEGRHKLIFEDMLKRLGGIDLPLDIQEQEYLDYVEATLDSHLLFMAETPAIEGDPYQLALRFEKDTIIYFLAMVDLVPESEKKFVQECIEEEKRHIQMIAKLKNK